MIPNRLCLRNFMCYGEEVPPLDFAGIHVAGLVGENGHGKSALLDAITWALWGKARTSRDDSLVRQGQTEMEVDLEFTLGEQRYRVVRRRTLRGQGGQTDLHLQAWTGSDYRLLTESTQRATQERILSLLRLDYETFVNSAFLVQGDADRFTTQKPGDRKRILGEILGLSRYDAYQERARERARQQAQRVTQLEGEIAEADRELAHEPLYQEQEREAEKKVVELEKVVREAEAARQAVGEQVRILEEREKEARALSQRVEQMRSQIQALARRIQEKETRLNSLEALVARREEILGGLQRLREAQGRLRTLMGLAETRRRLEAEKHQAEQRLLAARHELEKEAQVLRDRLEKARTLAASEALWRKRVGELQDRLAHLEAAQERQMALQEERQTLTNERAALQQENQRLKEEMQQLRERITLLEEAREPACPLCRQPLSPAERNRLVGEMTVQGQSLKAAHQENASRIEGIESRLKEAQVELKQLAQDLARLGPLQRELAAAEVSWQQSQQAQQEEGELRKALAELQERVEKGAVAPEEEARLCTLESELQKVAYDPQALQVTEQKVQELTLFEAEAARLEAAQEQVEGLRADLQEDRRQWEGQRAQAEVEEARQAELLREVGGLPSLRQDLQRREMALEKARADLAEARGDLGAARQRVAHCQYLRGVKREREKEKDKAAKEKSLFDELDQALGRRGVQALLIDQALPEIMEEANRLLGRMTDGRMHVELTTQRGTKSGGAMEVLDIIISDELGSRPYELYSGGEAFRINFALRVALSRLLARRAGARLQTLIVDEGFGALDASGRERLVEAINSISADFDCILVVTHVEELKELFPVRIEVTKGENGSTFTVR